MAERGYLVLSAIGQDRPGLVAALTAFIAGHHANVEDSRMAVLGGSFGIMMLISGSEDALAAVIAEADSLESATELRVHIDRTTAPAARVSERRYQIDVEAADREGIVQAIAEALFGIGGNIVSLESTIYPAPVSGAPLFRLTLLVDTPQSVSSHKLAAVIDEVAAAEDLDCRIGAPAS